MYIISEKKDKVTASDVLTVDYWTGGVTMYASLAVGACLLLVCCTMVICECTFRSRSKAAMLARRSKRTSELSRREEEEREIELRESILHRHTLSSASSGSGRGGSFDRYSDNERYSDFGGSQRSDEPLNQVFVGSSDDL